MSRLSKRRRRVLRRLMRASLFAVLLLGALPGLLLAAVNGQVGMLWISVVGMVAAPFLAVAAVLSLLTMSLPLLTVGLAFGAPLFLAYRALDARRPKSLDSAEMPAEVTLRRRYVAGDLSYEAFRSGMLDCLKERVTAGRLSLADYEAEVERLLLPGRQLDAGRDPSLSGTLGARPS